MEKTKQDYLNLLQETVEYYSQDPNRRGIIKDERNNIFCVYQSPAGNMCAAGRCMIAPRIVEANYGQEPINTLDNKIAAGFNSLLRPEYRGFNIDFWRHLQILHDGEHYWTATGLSTEGKEWVDAIMAWIEINAIMACIEINIE